MSKFRRKKGISDECCSGMSNCSFSSFLLILSLGVIITVPDRDGQVPFLVRKFKDLLYSFHVFGYWINQCTSIYLFFNKLLFIDFKFHFYYSEDGL